MFFFVNHTSHIEVVLTLRAVRFGCEDDACVHLTGKALHILSLHFGVAGGAMFGKRAYALPIAQGDRQGVVQRRVFHGGLL